MGINSKKGLPHLTALFYSASSWVLTSCVAWSRPCPRCSPGNGHLPWGRARLSWEGFFGVGVYLTIWDGVVRTLAMLRIWYQTPILHPPFGGFRGTFIPILVGAVPIPLIHFNYFDFLKPPVRWRTNSWIYLVRYFIFKWIVGKRYSSFHALLCFTWWTQSKHTNEKLASHSLRVWLWSSENNQCSKKPLCIQPKAGFTWIYRHASLMDDVVIWHQVQLRE